MAKEVILTQEGLEKLEAELENLKSSKRKEVAEKIKVALSFGDLSENSEYDEAKNEQGRVYSRISELTDILANYVIIEDTVATGEVGPGSQVKVRDLEDGFEEDFVIVGSQEADPATGRISDESPIGRALLGHRAGDEITVVAPAGVIQYLILEVQ